MSQPELPPSLFNSTPWNSAPEAIWVNSSMILRRNLARYSFPSKLEKGEAEQVSQALTGALKKVPSLETSIQIPQTQLSTNDRDLLLEHFLLMHGFPDSPNGASVILDKESSFLAVVNGENHLEMRVLCVGSEWEEKWNYLTGIEDQISKAEGYAFSPKFGYLTADPAQCGTGLTIHAFLHLPALIHTDQIDTALTNAEEDEVFFTGITGNIDDPIGDLIVIQNNFTIGMSEESILHAIQTAATKLIGAEKTMRTHLKADKPIQIKDLVSKAYGLLVHSYQLKAKEALNLISMMKLGLELGYVEGVNDEKLNNLFFNCRRGHLSHHFPDLKDPEELSHKRADYLQQELEGLKLSEEMQ